jgi:hypothetical protein
LCTTLRTAHTQQEIDSRAQTDLFMTLTEKSNKSTPAPHFSLLSVEHRSQSKGLWVQAAKVRLFTSDTFYLWSTTEKHQDGD